MKKHHLLIVALVLLSILNSCTKDITTTDDTITNDTITDITTTDDLQGLSYIWWDNFPFKDNITSPTFGGWINDSIYVFHSFDSVYHWMRINFTGDYMMEISEGLDAKYSKAFRFSGDKDTLDPLIFNPYTEGWSLIDTSYTVTKTRIDTAVYKGEYPNITFRVNGASTRTYTGTKSDFDYQFSPWTLSPEPYIHFMDKDSMLCYILVNYNSVYDTICRKFISAQQ